MIVDHLGKFAKIDASAYIAPNAMICGDVTIGANVRVMFGAQIIAENSPITIGNNCIILENAVIRGTHNFPVTIGCNCLIGPNSHLAGCIVEDQVFIATGASVFHGAVLKQGSEVRINGVVHLKTVLPEHTFVPIGWVAVGDPVQIFPPEKHDEIWAVQKALNFPGTVYNIDPINLEGNVMEIICKTMSARLGKHQQDGTG
ncbi:gamma carbonic anhydrase family protein [Robertkochia solimangrovi]|uniref:gamma carbonic anhydrase family protein n=1 Tax=Robertkochia solimangrovi TaxID=2213046 RepID=UPI001180761B|nr:gamma carbonic anhydrase family protein [Robertkochia solimangrovi]TRZ43542.1 gamma carbonic anhydrase family protein [Robertkochia solimangrovi]